MGRKKNITIQMHNKINDMLRIGESKHDAKQMYKEYCKKNKLPYNPAKTLYIHSTGTADAYRQTVGEFCTWLKAEKPEVWDSKNLEKIDKGVAYDYLKTRESQGCSAWSVSKDMSAINKVLNLKLNKKEGQLQGRSLENITRSRGERASDQKYNPVNYADQIEFAKAFGVRRESIVGGQFQVKECSLFKNNGKVFASVIEKGGRYREAQCLPSYQENIEAKYNIGERDLFGKDGKQLFIDIYIASEADFLFDKYTAKIDNHAFRAEYATSLYNYLVSQSDDVKSDYKGYDSSLLGEVSEALGHSRINVVVDHYLREK